MGEKERGNVSTEGWAGSSTFKDKDEVHSYKANIDGGESQQIGREKTDIPDIHANTET